MACLQVPVLRALSGAQARSRGEYQLYLFWETPGAPAASLSKTLKPCANEARRRENGSHTEGCSAVETVVKLLNEALATDESAYYVTSDIIMATGINAESVAAEFLQHANEEQGHADLIGARIVQLGGEPNLNPEGLLTRSHAEYVEGETLVDMIREDLVAERIAIDSYREMINYVNTDDPTTRRMLEGILAMEEEHADDLVSLLQGLGNKNLSQSAGQ